MPRSRRAAARRGLARAGDDRRRPPSLRDGAALPRRAPDVALVRGGSGLRLHPDAVPRRGRRAAHGPADPPDRARPGRRRRGRRCSTGSATLFEVQRDVARGGSAPAVRGRRAGTRRGRPVRALDARRRRAADRPPRGVRAVPARRRRRAPVARRDAARGRPRAPRRDRCRRASPPGAIAYTKSAAEAIERVEAGLDGADAAFLLEPTPVAAVLAVAADGDVMPQKSTYFYPKALTGLVINPHEW